MKQKPIIFGAEMVMAILAGTKTQTRRVITVPWHKGKRVLPYSPYCEEVGGRLCYVDQYGDFHPMEQRSPYGQPGDHLWVREAWRVIGWDDDFSEVVVQYRDGSKGWCDLPEPEYGQADDHWTEWLVAYAEKIADLPGVTHDMTEEFYKWDDDDVIPWRPSIHMPRWASRITLEVTGVRVERLQSISEEDAMAEGAPAAWGTNNPPFGYKWAFEKLWDSINGKRPGCSWADSPWVWAITFRRLEATP